MTGFNLIKSIARLLPRQRQRNANLPWQLAVPIGAQGEGEEVAEADCLWWSLAQVAQQQIKLRLISFIRLIPSSDAYAAPEGGDTARHVLHQTHEACCKGRGQEELAGAQVAALRA